MECDLKGLRKLVKEIRAGKPPKVPEGKFEEVYRVVNAGVPPGFHMRALHTGTCIFSVHWKRLGRQGKVTLGDARVLDPDQAIEAARDVLAKVQLRILDPQAAKREAMRTAKVTFESQVPAFLLAKKLRPNTRARYQSYLTGYYFKPLHRLPLDEITGPQIQTCLDKVIERSGGPSALSSIDTMKSFFKWAIKTHRLPDGHRNPMGSIIEPEASEPRARILTDDEIRIIWKACEDWEAEILAAEEYKRHTGKQGYSGFPRIPDNSRIARLLFLTGCRAQEIAELKWSEVDLDHGEIFISKERYKTKYDFHNPLADMAVQILRTVKRRPHDDFVFGSTGTGFSAASLNDRINGRIASVGKPAIDPIREQQVRNMLAAGIKKSRIRKEAKMWWPLIEKIEARMKAGTPVPAVYIPQKLEHWTVHDIRRTFRSRLSECGVPNEIAARLLGHRSPRDLNQTRIEQGYDRYAYWPEKKQALAKWQDKLRAIIDGTAEKIITPQFGRSRKSV
jgi:integrase